MTDKDYIDIEKEKWWYSLKNKDFSLFEKEKNRYMNIAKDSIKIKRWEDEKKQVTFRLSISDIEKIKKMAENEWIPYQTLIWAIIHKIANKKIELVLK